MLYDRGTIERYVFARGVSHLTMARSYGEWVGLTDLDVAWVVGRYYDRKPWVSQVRDAVGSAIFACWSQWRVYPSELKTWRIEDEG